MMIVVSRFRSRKRMKKQAFRKGETVALFSMFSFRSRTSVRSLAPQSQCLAFYPFTKKRKEMLQNSFRNIFFDKVFVLYVLDRSGDALSSIPCNSILKTILSISIREIRYKSGKCDLGKSKAFV